MIPWYTDVAVGISAAAGVLCLVLGLFGRKPNDLTLAATAIVELLLIVQLVIAIISPFVGNRPTGSIIEFYIYIVAAIVIPLIATFWSFVERDRWSTVILGIASLAVAVMIVRMDIIWTIQTA